MAIQGVSTRLIPGAVQRRQAAKLAEHPAVVEQFHNALYRTHSNLPLVPSKPAPPPAALPDARSIAADKSLRYDFLNREINTTYGELARRFQTILDPDFASRGKSNVPPTWYLFAAYSSKTVGKAEILCGAGLATLAGFRRWAHNVHHAGPGARPPVPYCRPGLHLLDALGLGVMTARMAARNVRYLPALNLSALMEPRQAVLATRQLIRAAEEADVSVPKEMLTDSINTLRNTLEQANRAIFTDLGVAGCDYIRWREKQPGVTPEAVLQHFSHDGSRPDEVRALYHYGVEQSKTAAPTELDKVPHTEAFNTASLIPAAFALFEKARTESGDYRSRLIECANNMLLFREQFHIVQPVYTPGAIQDHELDRNLVMKAVTPAIRLNLGRFGWKLNDYARSQQPGQTHWNRGASQYNWAAFEERWHPILDSLKEGYLHPAAMWPAPNPDPRAD